MNEIVPVDSGSGAMIAIGGVAATVLVVKGFVGPPARAPRALKTGRVPDILSPRSFRSRGTPSCRFDLSDFLCVAPCCWEQGWCRLPPHPTRVSHRLSCKRSIRFNGRNPCAAGAVSA